MTKLIKKIDGYAYLYECYWLGGSDSLIIVGEKIEKPEDWGITIKEDQTVVSVCHGLFPELVGEGTYCRWGKKVLLRSCDDGSSLYYAAWESCFLIVGKSLLRPDLLNMPTGPDDAAVIVPRELVKEKKCSVV